MPSSRTVMRATGTHGEAVRRHQRPHGAEHEDLVGQRVEERPERVVPLRRATHPSMPSVMQRTIHENVAAHDSGVSAISIRNGTVTSSRMMLMALAGVAMADGP